MTEDLAHIHVFKTNIRTETDKLQLKEVLEKHPINDWHVDTEDVDCVLRVVSRDMKPDQIITVVTQKGFYCTELE